MPSPNSDINQQSIFEDVKKFCMVTKENTEFDPIILVHINSAFASLRQMGVGPKQGFKIQGYSEKWSDYFENKDFVENVKEYVCIKTKLSFDTPQASGMKDALEIQLAETEYRVRIQWDDEMNINN